MPAAALLLQVNWSALTQDPRWTLLLALGLGGGAFLFFHGFRAWRHMRLVQDTPTSKVRSLALGRVEVHGRAVGKGELSAPITGLPCCYYRFQVEEEVRSNRNRRWRTVASGASEAWPFYVEDDTGRVLVDPRGARVDIPHDYRHTNPALEPRIESFLEEHGVRARGFLGFRRKLRLTEWHISPGDDLYVLGVAQERGGLVHERRVRIAEKLAALKADPEAMAHLDSDGDGRVSADEWEVARRLGVAEVTAEGFEDRVVIGEGEHGATPFYISDRDEKDVVRRHAWRSWGGVLGGPLLSVACLAGLLHQLGLLGR